MKEVEIGFRGFRGDEYWMRIGVKDDMVPSLLAIFNKPDGFGHLSGKATPEAVESFDL